MDSRLQSLFDSLVDIESVDDLDSLSAGDAVNVKNRPTHLVERVEAGRLHLYTVWLDRVSVTSFNLDEVSVSGNRILPPSLPTYQTLNQDDGKEYQWRARELRRRGLLE